MKWRKFIENYGMTELAVKLNIQFSTVRNWVKDGGVPKDQHKKALVKLAKGQIKYEDFFKGA